MKFNIKNGLLLKDYPLQEITKDYLNSKYTVHEICEKYNIGKSMWNQIIRYFKEHNIPLREYGTGNRTGLNKPKYYYHVNDSFQVRRTFNHKQIHFGTYTSEREAQERVKYLDDTGWEGYLK